MQHGLRTPCFATENRNKQNLLIASDITSDITSDIYAWDRIG